MRDSTPSSHCAQSEKYKRIRSCPTEAEKGGTGQKAIDRWQTWLVEKASFPELPRRHSTGVVEQPVEGRQIIKATGIGDLNHG